MRMLRKLYVQARLDIDDDMMDAMIANEHIPTDHDDNGILRVWTWIHANNILISIRMNQLASLIQPVIVTIPFRKHHWMTQLKPCLMMLRM